MVDLQGMLPGDGAPLVLMVSGGSDSTALCLVALELVEEGRLPRESVHILHIDHGLRGEDSDNDVLFVERLAGLCGFGFRCVAIDIASREAEFGRNMESTARHLRYEEAFRLLDELGALDDALDQAGDGGGPRIWTAHTRDDRVETFYMRSIVGTGPGGFASIAARNGIIARPLLSRSRRELRDYIVDAVSARGWELDPPERAQVEGGFWREDLTNYEDDGFRAYVRNRLVPVAEGRNPSLGATLERSMDLIAQESAFLDGLADEAARGAVYRTGSIGWKGHGLEVVLGLSKAVALHPVLLRRLVHRLCKEILPDDERVTSAHIERMVEGVGLEGLVVDLPGGAQMRREAECIAFLSAEAVKARALRREEERLAREETAALTVPGRLEFAGLAIAAKLVEADPACSNVDHARAHAADNRVYLDYGKLASAQKRAACETGVSNGGASGLLCLEVSHWREGDAMCPLGMNGAHKKLSDLFADKKVDRGARGKVVVVRVGDAIVWVAGMALDDRFKVEESGMMVVIEARALDVVG